MKKIALFMFISLWGTFTAPAPCKGKGPVVRNGLHSGELKASGENDRAFTFVARSYSPQQLNKELMALSQDKFRSHPLDSEVARRMHLFETTYSYYSEAAPGAFSDSKVIRKPAIYQAVHRADRLTRKAVKSGAIETREAARQLCHLLDTAIILYYCDTNEFEETLKDRRKREELLLSFGQVQFVDSGF